MRRLTRIVIVTGVILSALAVFVPLLMGKWFERTYRQFIDFYNTQGNVHLQIVEYQRGWFHSKAILNVEIVNSELIKKTQVLLNQSSPPHLTFTLTQQIQHGPFFYDQITHLPTLLGVAAIQNSIQLAPNIERIFQSLGIGKFNLQKNTDLFSLTGRYYKRIELAPFQVSYPDSKSHISLNRIQSYVWIWPGIKHIKGQLQLIDVNARDDQQNLMLSEMLLRFNQKQSPHNLWIGSDSLTISDMQWKEAEDGDLVVINGLDFKGLLDETHGFISGYRDFDIKHLQVNEQTLGPLHLQISMRDLNAKAIADMFDTYNRITKRGELYASQLQIRLIAQLPSVLSSSTRFSVDSFNVVTPNGELNLNGDITWAGVNFATLDSLRDFYEAALIKIHLVISKNLVDEIIRLISKHFYFYKLSLADNRMLDELRGNIRFMTQLNTAGMAGLVDNKLIKDQDGFIILNLQKEAVSSEYYNSVIKKLFLEKEISLVVSYFLYWQFVGMQEQVNRLNELESHYQNSYARTIQHQLDDFIEKGYVIQSDDDFILSIVRKDGVLKLNNKSM